MATAVGGNPEVVIHGETGLLVPARDPAAMSQAMLRLSRDAVLSRQLGLAGRQRAVTHFEVRRVVAAYEALYTPERMKDEG